MPIEVKKDKAGEYIEMEIDPCQGAAAMALRVASSVEGYAFAGLIRNGKKAKVYLKKIQRKVGKERKG